MSIHTHHPYCASYFDGTETSLDHWAEFANAWEARRLQHEKEPPVPFIQRPAAKKNSDVVIRIRNMYLLVFSKVQAFLKFER